MMDFDHPEWETLNAIQARNLKDRIRLAHKELMELEDLYLDAIDRVPRVERRPYQTALVYIGRAKARLEGKGLVDSEHEDQS